MRTRSCRLTLLRFCTPLAKVVHYPKLVMFEEALFSSLSPRCNDSDDWSMGPDLTEERFLWLASWPMRVSERSVSQSLGSDLSEMASELTCQPYASGVPNGRNLEGASPQG
jgi:hypothetical protein